MKIRGVVIEDTFAEAFTMRVARIIITGSSMRWVRAAALKLTGFATSVIGCKVEAGIERELSSSGTPDGRPGTSVLLMTMSKDDLGKRLIERIGQTVLTCPTTACYDGLPDAPDRVGVGSALRFFGDGFQGSKVIGGQRFWRITFPLSLPGVYAGAALVFIPALGIFAIPDILGGPNDTLIGNLIKQQFLETRDWPFGSVLSIVLTVAALALAGIAAWVGRRGGGATARA